VGAGTATEKINLTADGYAVFKDCYLLPGHAENTEEIGLKSLGVRLLPCGGGAVFPFLYKV
jgi:hypothetical protein